MGKLDATTNDPTAVMVDLGVLDDVVNGPEGVARLGRRRLASTTRNRYGGYGKESSRRRRQADWRTVRKLQKLMLRCRANTLLSVRRVAPAQHGPPDGRG